MTSRLDEASPLCRCRVLYLGSAVPQVTKDGLQGIQDPLKELYPETGASGVKGIDSWLSVWSNGLLLENVDENHKKVTRFYPIDTLHYCAAVRYVQVPGSKGEKVTRFLPLDSPFARNPSIKHPPLFACILRRTAGIKVLECHTFICKKETPANALVRCCFHAYADNMYAKQIESSPNSVYGTIGSKSNMIPPGVPLSAPVNSIDKVAEWKVSPSRPSSSTGEHTEVVLTNGSDSPHTNGINISEDEISLYNGDENHKVWAGQGPLEKEGIYADYGTSTIRSVRSVGSTS